MLKYGLEVKGFVKDNLQFWATMLFPNMVTLEAYAKSLDELNLSEIYKEYNVRMEKIELITLP